MWSTIKSYLQLVRWSNLIMIMILVWTMDRWVAASLVWNPLPWWILALLMLSITLISAGGYVINDYFDVKIDKINHPDKLIVTTIVSKHQAIRCHQLLTILGIFLGLVVAWWCHSWSLVIVIALVPGLLWFYSSSYKRQFILGNIMIAFLAALPPLTVAIANTGHLQHLYADLLQYSTVEHDLYAWLGSFALFAFLTTLIREIMKDMEDQQGDRELECHTLPIRLGDWGTKWVVTMIGIITIAVLVWMGLCIVPYDHSWNTLSTRYIAFGILTPLICSLWLMWAAKIPSDYHVAQSVMKFTMLMGILYSFVIQRSL